MQADLGEHRVLVGGRFVHGEERNCRGVQVINRAPLKRERLVGDTTADGVRDDIHAEPGEGGVSG